jgi:hypothetical protein
MVLLLVVLGDLFLPLRTSYTRCLAQQRCPQHGIPSIHERYKGNASCMLFQQRTCQIKNDNAQDCCCSASVSADNMAHAAGTGCSQEQ